MRVASIERVVREGRRVSVHVQGFEQPLPVGYRLAPALFCTIRPATIQAAG